MRPSFDYYGATLTQIREHAEKPLCWCGEYAQEGSEWCSPEHVEPEETDTATEAEKGTEK